MTWRRLALAAALLACAAVPARSQQVALTGWCESGNQPVVVSGLTSTTLVMASYPACQISVFVHGGGLATITADSVGTPLSNPFNASSNGQWIFYGPSGTHVDVQMTGGLPVPGFPTPITLSDIILGGGGGGGGGAISLQTNNVSNVSQTLLNFVTGPAVGGLSIVPSNPSGGIVQFSLSGTFNPSLLPATLVYNNASNTYTTGTQNLSAATDLVLPSGSSFIPPDVGGFGFNSSQGIYVGRIGALPFYPWGSTTLNGFNFGHCLEIGTSVGVLQDSGAGCGGSAPGAPSSSLQFNGSGILTGADILFTPTGGACLAGVTCSLYKNSSVGTTLTLLPNSDPTPTRGNSNIIVHNAGPLNGGGTWLSVNLAGPAAIGSQPVSNSAISARGAVIGLNGAVDAFYGIATDDYSDTTSGQVLKAAVLGVGLSKLSGSVALGVGLDIQPVASWATNGLGACCNLITESVTNMYGIRVEDQGVGGHTTGEQAAIKILAQTAGSGTNYSIMAAAGSGAAFFGDGVADNTLTPGNCVQAATVGGLTRLTTISGACGSSGGGTPGGSTTQFQYNNAGAFGGTTGLTWNNTSNVPSLALGTITTDINPLSVAWTTNNSSVLFHGVQWVVTNSAFATGTFNYMLCGGSTGILCFTIDTGGNVAAAGSIATGNSSVAGNLTFPQGPLPGFGALVNAVQFAAPTSVPTNYQIVLPTAPCAGFVTWALSSSVSTQNCGGAPTQYLATNYTNATTTFSNLLAFTAAASTSYTMTCNLVYSASAATAGPKIEITGPASPTAVTYSYEGATGATAFSGASATAFSSSLSIGASVTTTTPMPFQVTMSLINGTTAGTVQVLAAAQGTGTLTIYAGSSCEVTP